MPDRFGAAQMPTHARMHTMAGGIKVDMEQMFNGHIGTILPTSITISRATPSWPATQYRTNVR